MLVLRAQRAPWHFREGNGKILAMATGKNALSTLHENILAMATGKIALSTLHEIFGHCNGEKALQENVMLSQQGVRFVISSRGKKCEVILSVFCLSSENHLRICVCICNLFFGGRDEVQKKMIFWKNGGGGKTKCGFNKRSITPPY